MYCTRDSQHLSLDELNFALLASEYYCKETKKCQKNTGKSKLLTSFKIIYLNMILYAL